jgi:hypothetical protein
MKAMRRKDGKVSYPNTGKQNQPFTQAEKKGGKKLSFLNYCYSDQERSLSFMESFPHLTEKGIALFLFNKFHMTNNAPAFQGKDSAIPLDKLEPGKCGLAVKVAADSDT